MRILIESSNTNYNWGDASMLVVAIQRLRALFPDARITLLRSHEAFQLTEAAGGVQNAPKNAPKGTRIAWISQRPIWRRTNKMAPHLIDRLHASLPRLMEIVGGLKMRALGYDVAERDAFLALFDQADVLVVSGGGFMTDLFSVSDQVLSLIQLARTRGVPVYMFGQGIGPIEDDRLFRRARYALPQVEHIALREGRFSRSLLHQLGVPDDKIAVVGDDAVALAYPERPGALGNGIGVNLRIASYSEVPETTAAVVSKVLRDASADLDASLRPVPIAFAGKGSDVETIRHLLDQCDVDSDGGAALDSPGAVIRQVSRCRVVVTGSYHGGVFALSQGLPVVALSCSTYYDRKFLGLADQFGTGCTVLRTDRTDFEPALRRAIHAAWEEAEDTRAPLLEAARQQVDAAEAAYARVARSMGKEKALESDFSFSGVAT